jgi:hypothetical protein
LIGGWFAARCYDLPGVLMRRAIQITVVTALILLGPGGAVADAVCWWSLGCFAGFERCQLEVNWR